MSQPTQRGELVGQIKAAQAILRELEIAAEGELLRGEIDPSDEGLFRTLAFEAREQSQTLARLGRSLTTGVLIRT